MRIFFRMLRTAFLLRCPRCDKKGLYYAHINIKEKCPHCGLPTSKEGEGYGGSLVINYSITLVFALGFITPAIYYELFNSTVISLIGAGVAMIVMLAIFPYVKNYWLCIMYKSEFLEKK